jgi:predicted PurR-regulated permease PerM
VNGESRALVVVLTVALLALGCYVMAPVVAPVIIASQLAIVLAPWHDRVAARLGRRAGLAPVITTLGALLGILGPTLLIFAMTLLQLRGVKTSAFAGTVRQLSTIGIRFVQRTFGWLSSVGIDMSYQSLKSSLEDGAQAALGRIGDHASEWASAAPDALVGISLFVIALYFWLRDGAAFVKWASRSLPFSDEDSALLFDKVRATARDVVVSQLFTGAVQAGLALAFLFLLQVPGAFLWGILAFVLSFIPLFGTTPVTLGATVYLFAVGRPTAGLVMGVGILVIGASDNVVRPLVASSSGNLHPLVTLMAIFGGLAALGASGVFLGPLVAALAQWALEMYGRKQATA